MLLPPVPPFFPSFLHLGSKDAFFGRKEEEERDEGIDTGHNNNNKAERKGNGFVLQQERTKEGRRKQHFR